MIFDGTARERYEALKPAREPALRRARRCAALTIPSILPPLGHSNMADLPEPNQSFGARCVTHLSSKIMAAMLPIGLPILRLDIPPATLAKAGLDSVPTDLEKKFALADRTIHAEINRRNWRPATNVAAQHLIVAGNVLEKMLPDNSLRYYRLDQYVVVRTPSGKQIEIVIEEIMTPASTPDALLQLAGIDRRSDATLHLYTWVKLDPNTDTWHHRQEIEDKVIDDSVGTYSKRSPFNALRWTEVLGEPYGRGKVEEHVADIQSIDRLQKAITEGAAMASRNITMVKPNAAGGLNLRRRLARAANGEIVVGNPEDVQMLKYDNIGGMQFAAQDLQNLKSEVGGGFLLNSAVRRDAERVTAYELQQMVGELEGVLGGVYSTLSQEMALPRANRLILQMQKQQALPSFTEDQLEPTILTGLEALGREQDVSRVGTAIQFTAQLPDEGKDYVKWPVLITKVFNGLSLPDAVHSEEEVAQKRQERAMLQAMTAAAPQVAGNMTAPEAPAA